MRIAYVCADPGVPVFGQKGCSIHVQEVLRSLVRKGIEVELLAARVGGPPPSGLEGIRVRSIPGPRECEDLATFREQLASEHDEIREALHAAAPLDAVYERFSLWSDAGMRAAAAARIPGLLEVNAPLVEEQAAHRGLQHRELAEHVARSTFRAAAMLLPVSTWLADYLRREVGSRRIHVVPNAIDPARFAGAGDAPEACVAREHFTVGFVGSLKPWHGLWDLAHGFARLHSRDPQARLLVVGDGPERDGLESQLTDLGIRNAATLTGSVPSERIPALLAEMHVAVCPYPPCADSYFSPIKLFEYMGAGLPIVASAVGQALRVIEHERTGLLCEPGDVEALAQALWRLRRDPALANRIGCEARRVALLEHTWDARVDTVLHVAGLTH